MYFKHDSAPLRALNKKKPTQNPDPKIEIASLFFMKDK